MSTKYSNHTLQKLIKEVSMLKVCIRDVFYNEADKFERIRPIDLATNYPSTDVTSESKQLLKCKAEFNEIIEELSSRLKEVSTETLYYMDSRKSLSLAACKTPAGEYFSPDSGNTISVVDPTTYDPGHGSNHGGKLYSTSVENILTIHLMFNSWMYHQTRESVYLKELGSLKFQLEQRLNINKPKKPVKKKAVKMTDTLRGRYDAIVLNNTGTARYTYNAAYRPDGNIIWTDPIVVQGNEGNAREPEEILDDE